MSRQVFCTDVLDGDGSAGDAVVVCTAQLDLDLETEVTARRELARLGAGTCSIVVDVSEVFVAVAGFRLLMDFVQELRRTGRRAELVVDRHLQRVAHVFGEPPDVLWSTLPDALVHVRTPIPGTDDPWLRVDGGGERIGALAEWLDREAGHATVSTSLVELMSGLEVSGLLVEQLLGRVERVLGAAEGVLGVDRVGLMLLDEHDRLQVVGASDPASDRLERGQQQLGIGPAVDSVRSARPVAVSDLAESGREQPEYAPLWEWLQHEHQSAGNGAQGEPQIEGLVRSVLSVPVRARGRVLGSLNLVCSRPGAWSNEQLRAGQAYADVIGVLLSLSAPGPSTAESSA